MEEKAMIRRKETKFRPPIAPTRAERIAEKMVILIKRGVVIRYESKIIGASFCRVIRRRVCGQASPSTIWGNQK